MSTRTAQPRIRYLPLNMNGLSGRMLKADASGRYKKEILFIYGHHSSLERVEGLVEYLARYGNVTVPDLPGFGGMESFYKIGKKPTIDNMADYLAAFIKLRYRNKRLTVAGVSFGFLVVTRMLQKYPDIVSKVDTVISAAGFVHHDDFRYKKSTYWIFRFLTKFLSGYLTSVLLNSLLLRSSVIRFAYRFVEPKLVDEQDSKIREAADEEREKRIEFEIKLWQCNDIRTYMYIGHQMLLVDLCGLPIPLPVHHIAATYDRYFNNLLVEEHMRTIYKDFTELEAGSDKHAPSVIASADEAAVFFTPKLKALLRKKL